MLTLAYGTGAATEAFLLKRMSKVAMSKTLTVAASVGEAVFALLYGLSKSAESATVRRVHGLT